MRTNNRKNTGTRNTAKRNRAKRMVIVFICMMVMTLGIFMKVSVIDVNADVPERYKYYTSVYIDRDDTLWDIATEYISSEYSDIRDYMEEVKMINHLEDDELPYGITICVPYYSDELKQ